MSFGDGNLRERVGDLNRQVDKLQRVNGELCAEINRQERRIRELEALVLDMWHELNYTSIRAEDGCNRCLEKMAVIDERMKKLGLMEVDA